jgi:TRAP-type mannitol/chloroaromatic compound transport system substrate-binding protein
LISYAEFVVKEAGEAAHRFPAASHEKVGQEFDPRNPMSRFVPAGARKGRSGRGPCEKKRKEIGEKRIPHGRGKQMGDITCSENGGEPMKMRQVLSLALLCSWFSLLVLALLPTNPSIAAGEVIKWKCQSIWPSASPSYADSLLVIVEDVKKNTNGRLIIEPFPARSLVPSKEVFNAVKRGVLPMGQSSPAYMRDQIPIANFAAGLPYSFKEVWEAAYFHKRLGFEQMMKDEAAKHGLAYYTDKVYPTELVLKKPVKSFDDFKGLKIRSSGALKVYFTSIGAAAAYITGAEVYPSLASGVVDAAHWGAAQGANKMGFYDIAKYHMKPAFNIAGTDAWIVNKKALNKLPKDIRDIFENTMEKHFWMRTNQYIFQESTTLAMVQKEKNVKVITLPPAEQEKMTQAAMAFWEEVGKKGPEAAKALKIMKDFLRKMGHIQ